MNALDKIGMNPLPLRADSMLTRIAAGLGVRAAGADAGPVARQPAGPPTDGAQHAGVAEPSTQATVSIDARVLAAISRLPGELPQIVAAVPLHRIAPQDAAAAPVDSGDIRPAPGAALVSGTTRALAAGVEIDVDDDVAPLLLQSLIQSLESSGLFYESHLAQWANGQRPVSSLDREPQSQLLPMFRALAGGPDEAPGIAGRDDPPGAGLDNRATRMAGDALLQTIHPEIVSTVRQQLELLQNPLLRWHGEAWPGARLDWTIERRDNAPAHTMSDVASEPAWRMHLSLDLPHLGPVDAELQLAGTRLIARLKARPASASSLLHDSDDLRCRLAGTGLELKGFAVREMASTRQGHDG